MGNRLLTPDAFLAVSWNSESQAPNLGGITSYFAHTHVGASSAWFMGADAADSAVQPSSSDARILGQLTLGSRVHGRDVTASDVERWLQQTTRDSELDQVLPPFAAFCIEQTSDTVRLAVDRLGFRQIYYVVEKGWAAIGTATGVLAKIAGSSLDRRSLAVLSLLGWQAGDATIFQGIKKLDPGAMATLHHGEMVIDAPILRPPEGGTKILKAAASRAADILVTEVTGLLEQHPETTLQLTGGLDSRILLAAIPERQRREVRALTLQVGGSPDVAIASGIAARYGMRHEVIPVNQGEITPEDAGRLAIQSATKLNFSSDPLAGTMLAVAEGAIDQAPRLSGLGGEVVRGFYYIGPRLPWRSTQAKVRMLADWRLFPNESVPDEALHPRFREDRRELALSTLEEEFSRYGRLWEPATDEFYLWQRMQRWAGSTTTSTCMQRLVVNPMLSTDFVDLGRGLDPKLKANMLYLSTILSELDRTLSTIPLDGRPAPEMYARRGVSAGMRSIQGSAMRVVRKSLQRARGNRRPSAEAPRLAEHIVRHWGENPEPLDRVRNLDLVSEEWLERVLTRPERAAASAVAFLVSLQASLTSLEQARPGC